LDSRTHLLLLPRGEHVPGVLKGKCGHYLVETTAAVDPEPPLSGRCPQCQLIHTGQVHSPQWVISPYDLTEHLLCEVQPTRFDSPLNAGTNCRGTARPHPVPVLRTVCPTCAAHAVVNAS
jgi:hypothetical protein